MNAKFLVGSRVFFAGMDGYKSKDKDYLVLVENPTNFEWRRERSVRGVCCFEIRKESISKMVKRTLASGSAIMLGKFLVPEVAKALKAKVKDILPLEPLLEKLDDKHKYQAVIFRAYQENGDFTLTDEQRAEAYAVYCQSRQKHGNETATTAENTEPKAEE